MKDKTKPGSKIPTTGKNTNQKKRVKSDAGIGLGSSLLRMNEFTLIIIGALVVTVLVFFLFFRSPDTGTVADEGAPPQTISDAGLERRIAALELAMARIASSPDDTAAPKEQAGLDQRITRLETAMTLKLDSLLERMARMENQMKNKAGAMKTAAAAPVKPVAVKTASTSESIPQKAPATKKPALPKKKVQQFHTVKKGETLWSISQKYNTTVAAIRKLNKLSAEDKIYVGNNILVR